MNIQRYFAPDMRRAINIVRTRHGPDAVILSSESVDGGIEIIAAVDYDPSLMTRMLDAGAPLESSDSAAEPEASVESDAAAAGEADRAVATNEVESQPEPSPEPSPEPGPADTVGLESPDESRLQAASNPVPTRTSAEEIGASLPAQELRAIQKDLNALKGLVRERFAWSDLRAMTPQRSRLLRRAEIFGLTAELADTLVTEVQHPEVEDRAWREIVFGLARRIKVMRNDPLDQGGIFALVGPTGAGKTTTIAKLAARHCLKFGRESLGLITTDNFRIGARRQLDALASILGVSVRSADSPERLTSILSEFSNRRLVLIDTTGVAPRDAGVTESLVDLSQRPDIRRFLVLAANMQAAAMQDAVRGFDGTNLAGAVLTKTDEATGLGAAISVLIDSDLPAVWITDGQRVPQDLEPARVANLLKRATVFPETAGDACAATAEQQEPAATERGEVRAND